MFLLRRSLAIRCESNVVKFRVRWLSDYRMQFLWRSEHNSTNGVKNDPERLQKHSVNLCPNPLIFPFHLIISLPHHSKVVFSSCAMQFFFLQLENFSNFGWCLLVFLLDSCRMKLGWML